MWSALENRVVIMQLIKEIRTRIGEEENSLFCSRVVRLYLITDEVCAQMHILRYTANVHLMDFHFLLYFTVCAYLIAPHMCVLLNIIFNPHLFEKLMYATIFFPLYKSMHCHFRCKIDFFFCVIA